MANVLARYSCRALTSDATLHLSFPEFLDGRKCLIRIFVQAIRAMNVKLTLSIEEEVIRKAKDYAQTSGRSLSDLVQSYLERITSHQDNSNGAIPDAFKDLYGSVPIPENLEHKKAIRSIMAKKHGN